MNKSLNNILTIMYNIIRTYIEINEPSFYDMPACVGSFSIGDSRQYFRYLFSWNESSPFHNQRVIRGFYCMGRQ